MTRGIRNNNPGNIRHGDKWQGLRDTQTDKSFCQFTAPEWGIRAMLKILRNYERKYGYNTVRQIITRWAPPNENNTEAYIAYVCDQVGVASSTVIDVDNAATLCRLVKAMIQMENGQQPYSDAVIMRAFELL
ncbi:structural protein [Xenorhabdus sp. DI]|uniref:structural protein n=1 Tax=Xenorhabdus doucetiae TaxID=351671 RepID=UPI001996CEA0|nr:MULTISPECIES: structural protein [unclassified Xenorhabdus]MBD2783791.1 structural protein [Xenorhabdus sp. 3]MBD2789978.1 structural protein [Xenorhabdus sp. DI]